MKKIALLLIVTLTIFLSSCEFTSVGSTETPITTTAGQTTSTNGIEPTFENLFDDSIYKKFEIYFSEANFLKLIYDMENYRDQFGSYRDNTIQEVDITYTDSTGLIYEVNEVGFRTKGNVFTRVLPVIKDELGNIVGYQQVSFQLEFNATFDYIENSTEYNYLQSREVFDLDQLNFKHIRYDTGVVTESVSYDFYREAGVYTSSTSYAIIYFNIEGNVIPYGLYMLQEPVDDMFVERYFGENQDGSIGDLYKCTWQSEAATLKNNYESYSLGVSNYMEGYRKSYALKTNKINPDFSSFEDFVVLANQIDVASYYTHISQSLDVDAFARALAMGFLIGSPDDYRSNANNYYMYFNNSNAYYIPFDMDNALGFGWNPYYNYGLTLANDSVQPSSYNASPANLILPYRLLNDADFLALYQNYLIQYISDGGIFNYDTYLAEHNLIQDLYLSEILSEGHLGINDFVLENRGQQDFVHGMPASDYFEQKIANIKNQLGITS